MKILRVAMAMLIVGLWSSTATSAPDDYLQGFPTLEHVMAETRGSDELDTAARQAAAFNILSDVVVTLAPGRDTPGGGSFSPKEQALNSLYKNAEVKADMVAYRIVDPKNIQNDARDKWNKHRDEYIASGSFRDSVLRFLPQEQRVSLAEEFKKRVSEIKALSARRIALAAKPVVEMSTVDRDLAPRSQLLSQLALVAGMMLVFGIARELRPFGLDSSNEPMIRAGGKRHHIYSFAGMALSPTKTRETRTSVSGGYNNTPISSSTSTTVHDQFFLRDKSGAERAFQLTNLDVAVREGHDMVVLWANRKGKGGYFLFNNRSTSSFLFINGVLSSILQPRMWLVLPVTVIGMWLGGVSLLTCVIVPIAFFVWRAWIRKSRMRRFKKEILEKLLPKL
jgi:hypothetical protein